MYKARRAVEIIMVVVEMNVGAIHVISGNEKILRWDRITPEISERFSQVPFV